MRDRQTEVYEARIFFPAFPHTCKLAFCARGQDKDLPAEERALILHGSKKRRQQFVWARKAAHRVLDPIGLRQHILKNTHGAPVWPEPIRGSLAHTKDMAICALSSSPSCLSLGVDIENKSRSFNMGIAEKICHPLEMAWLDSRPEIRRLQLLKILSAKEAIYKAVHVLTGVGLGFQDAVLQPNPQGFLAEVHRSSELQMLPSSAFQIYTAPFRQWVISLLSLSTALSCRP